MMLALFPVETQATQVYQQYRRRSRTVLLYRWVRARRGIVGLGLLGCLLMGTMIQPGDVSANPKSSLCFRRGYTVYDQARFSARVGDQGTFRESGHHHGRVDRGRLAYGLNGIKGSLPNALFRDGVGEDAQSCQAVF